jgi:outer membrane protein OmpA-like peptidoglycan-associated protein
MTSLAVIFAVLLVAFVHAAGQPEERSAAPPERSDVVGRGVERVRTALERVSPTGIAVDADRADPQALRVVIPESLLNFELGKSQLTPAAEEFVAGMMPSYARALCGSLRAHVEGIVIEGHTDDLGEDVPNLRLSQERSLRVLIGALDAIRTSAPEVYACFGELASASGRGKQDLVYDDQGRADRARSRRVALKILLRASITGS